MSKKIGELVPLVICILELIVHTILAAYEPSIIVVPDLSLTGLNYNFAPTTFLCI
jgi:hypothetical protein